MTNLEKDPHFREVVGKKICNLLNKEFLSRCEKNSRYSLRAFAKSISLDPTFLSRLMKGQRKPSAKMIKNLVAEMDLNIEDINAIFLKKKESKQSEVVLNEPQLRPISKWYFFAILDLFLLKGFKSDAEWMAKRLDLSVSTVNAALMLLRDINYIDLNQKNWKLNTASTTWTSFESTDITRKNLQKQILTQAIKAIDEIDFTKRETASLSLPASTKLMPEIKKRIQKFKNELRELIEASGDYEEVYQLSVSYFPLSRDATLKENK